MDLDSIAVFVKVVQAGSFSQAARLLGMPNTTVSAKVARLEKGLGVTLIRRTTRKLHVTPAGQAFFERCLRGLSEIATAQAELSAASAEPRGALRLTAPGDVAYSLLPGIASRYLRTYPQVRLEIIVANRLVDLVGEGVDLAIRGGELRDSTLIARRFITLEFGLWASRGYVARRGTPRSPAELASHDVIAFVRRSGQPIRMSDGRQHFELPTGGRLIVDDLETLRALVLKDNGIGVLPHFLTRQRAADRALVRVLPDWSWAAGALSFVYPNQPFVPTNVRAFIDVALASIDAGRN
ncbi:MAG TPA: LysR family transcriptional regulator [Burkholderiaceae bacterium]|nr:LysR family transcriptional regulator [Burkholderiaceae bacterium]